VRLALGMLLAFVLALALSGRASAANISRFSSFECGYHSITVYFPELYTSSGSETVYYSPDLWLAYGGYFHAWDTSAPWYRATVGPSGTYSINGFKWWTGTNYQTPYRSVYFSNVTPGKYMVKGYFYGGSSHWANVLNTNDAACNVW
jgi:hypothetical protein